MPSPTIFSYSLRDDDGNKFACDIYVAYDASTETVSALLGAAAAFGGLLDAVTGCVITQFNIKVNADPDPSWKTSVAGDVDGQKSLLENFNADGTKYPQELLVPGIRESLLVQPGDRPIIASGAIKDMNDALIGSVGTGVFANNKFLLDLVALRNASVTFRKRKGARQETTVVP